MATRKEMPIYQTGTVYHVGQMDISKKNDYSYEGDGLSVSLCPDAWKKISETTCGDTHKLTKKNGEKGRFLDVRKLNKRNKQEILDYGRKLGLIEDTIMYCFTYFDDELEADCKVKFKDKEEAILEAEDFDIEEDKIYTEKDIIPTEKMKQSMQFSFDEYKTFDILTTLYAEQMGLDGCWWKDVLDVSRYSAPRGVILNSMLSEWESSLA